jgi:pimeloyl-ACP methyl ester carboxylesterase
MSFEFNRRSFVLTSAALAGSCFGVRSIIRAAEPQKLNHTDLTRFVSSTGKVESITDIDEWKIRRARILANMQQVMGKFPNKVDVKMNVKVIEQTTLEDGLQRQKLAYHTDSKKRQVRAWLMFDPKVASQKKKTPAILCLHQTTRIGKDEPAGLGGNKNLHYALHLARRGYVALAPDYPSFGEYAYDFPASDGYQSGTMKAIVDNVRAIDLLQALPYVDPEKIGCIGHSLGGHNTMFTAAFDDRIKAIVSNCGFTRFHKYYNGRLKGWTSNRYMPAINSVYMNDPDKVPFDFPEIIGLFAPRAFLASSPVRDGNFEVSGVRDSIKAASFVYDLYGQSDRLKANYPDSGHDFPEDARKIAYSFIDKHLKK